MSDPISDLLEQYRTRRARDLQARHCADAASRAMALTHELIVTSDGAGAAIRELEGAVEEWNEARTAWPPHARYTLHLGRLIVSTTTQPAGAPRVDQCMSRVASVDTVTGRKTERDAQGWAIRLAGDLAVVVAIIGWKRPARARARRPHSPGMGPMGAGTVADFARMATGGPQVSGKVEVPGSLSDRYGPDLAQRAERAARTIREGRA